MRIPSLPMPLRIARISAGLSQGRLANLVGCARSRIQRIESGGGYVLLTGELAAKIAAAVRVEAAELFGGRGMHRKEGGQ